MGLVKSKDTKPEIAVRRLIHHMGYRYRLHARDLPGSPDIVFRKKKKVIFVHGCFWHLHKNCKLTRTPKTRTDFWQKKLRENALRDVRNQKLLADAGWDIMVIWECELAGKVKLGAVERRISEFLATNP